MAICPHDADVGDETCCATPCTTAVGSCSCDSLNAPDDMLPPGGGVGEAEGERNSCQQSQSGAIGRLASRARCLGVYPPAMHVAAGREPMGSGGRGEERAGGPIGRMGSRVAQILTLRDAPGQIRTRAAPMIRSYPRSDFPSAAFTASQP